MRYALPLNNPPSKCDECGAKFSLGHAQSCKNGGAVIGRHDEISYELKQLCAIALGERNVRSESLINPGSASALKSKCKCNDSNNDITTADLRGDILLSGIFENKRDCIIDV